MIPISIRRNNKPLGPIAQRGTPPGIGAISYDPNAAGRHEQQVLYVPIFRLVGHQIP